MSLTKKLLFSFVVGITLGILIIPFARYQQIEQTSQITRYRPAPEFVVIHGVSQEYDENGALIYEMSAARLAHYADSRISLLDKPKIRIRDKTQRVWLVSSESGTLNNDDIIVSLNENVQVQPELSQKPMMLNTQAMTLNTRQATIHSDELVTLHYADNNMRSLGLVADLNEDKIWLTSQVHATYQPAKGADNDQQSP